MSTENLFKQEACKQDTSLDVRMEYNPGSNRFFVYAGDTELYSSQSPKEADDYYTNFCYALASVS